ncbi:MAG: hypothetical protein GY839_05685 [candidate division Zixibacteria bacterium]|nr:hypothetical protein [candidate division Zixibacteria bacterium]
MKQYTHAWLGLKAIELLRSYAGRFSDERNEHLEDFLRFISSHPSTFVRGAWFPDTHICDNLQGGHTWKYKLDAVNGIKVKYRPPMHNNCYQLVKDGLKQKISLNVRRSDLPDRCEALSLAIRDMILITNKVESGDVVAFNDSQVALLFLMLAHYACDAHVPVHCDDRDLNKPPKVHGDLEEFWEDEILKFYKVSTENERFNLDENYSLQLDDDQAGFTDSILYKCDEVLKESEWSNLDDAKDHWSSFLGKKNNNFWDYLVSVCLVSFHMSLKMFPIDPPDGIDYETLRIMETSPFKEDVLKYSPLILADAINTVSLLWLASWERWELLKKEAISA